MKNENRLFLFEIDNSPMNLKSFIFLKQRFDNYFLTYSVRITGVNQVVQVDRMTLLKWIGSPREVASVSVVFTHIFFMANATDIPRIVKWELINKGRPHIFRGVNNLKVLILQEK